MRRIVFIATFVMIIITLLSACQNKQKQGQVETADETEFVQEEIPNTESENLEKETKSSCEEETMETHPEESEYMEETNGPTKENDENKDELEEIEEPAPEDSTTGRNETDEF